MYKVNIFDFKEWIIFVWYVFRCKSKGYIVYWRKYGLYSLLSEKCFENIILVFYIKFIFVLII